MTWGDIIVHMTIKIKHNLYSWEGGIEIDDVIRKFCEKLDMKEGQYSKYYPQYRYLEYINCNMKQFNELKKRLNRSKRLKKNKNGVDVEIKFDVFGVC